MKTRMKAPKGTVTIKVRGKGRILYIALPRTFFGIPKEFSLGIPSTPENCKFAELKTKQMELDFLSGNFDVSLAKYKLPALPSPEPAIDRLTALPDIYTQYINSRKKLVSPSTWKNTYINTLNHLNRCPYKSPKDALKIKDWAIENLTVDAANRILMQANAACKWAVEREILASNPFEGKSKIKGKKSKPKIHPFSELEKAEILKAFEESEKWQYLVPAIKFFFLTGCRTSEAFALKWRHISSDCSEISFEEAIVQGEKGATRKLGTKQSNQRSFPCNSQLQELLRSIQPADRNSESPVFCRPDGSAIASSDLRSAWYGKGDKPGIVKQLAIDARIEAYRPQYNTRHTFITHCLEAGISPVQIAEWVGNSAKIIFGHYAGVVNKKEVPEF